MEEAIKSDRYVYLVGQKTRLENWAGLVRLHHPLSKAECHGKAKRRHLNAVDCEELRRNAEGVGALTQPHTVRHTQGSCKPNHGLYPRTSSKRQKCAQNSAVKSSPGKQTCITNFSVPNGSPSPRQSSQPWSSTQANNSNTELYPKQQTDSEESDDDASSLAAALTPDSEAEEEGEVDDASLLGLLETEINGTQVDYLEGMTSELFGGDEAFDACDERREQEEVEALPDAHFGLLGSGGRVVQPQGCMDDLPEEVLWQVLCQVPAQDLYRNASLVCHRWRNIIEDPKFVPYKKKYYRCMMGQEDTTLELQHTLVASEIISQPDSTIRKLVVLLAQHQPRERVRPEDVLGRVKKHRLFPQAEASIRLCIPDIEESFNLGLEGPNPFAAMAVILILSENVADVQALASLLGGCVSEVTVAEFLSHAAMLLLAMMKSRVQISNRLHYKIYYVLHLMENGPFSVSSRQSRQPQIRLTREQQQILSHDIRPEHIVKIVAFAGTGKTTTLVRYAEQRPDLRFLYVAFNKSVAKEAERCFPWNVSCKTVHSLAYKDVGELYITCKKLTPDLKPFALNSVLPKGRGGFSKAKVVALTLNAFMASVDGAIGLRHVPTHSTNKAGERKPIDEKEKALFVRDAKRIWEKMVDPEMRGCNMTHDGYLKLWQLRSPKPRLSDQYDVLFIDEAQDCTPVIMDVLLNQNCGKILVGDPHQQIYAFRGAVNALNIVGHTHIYYLTQSFRFGSEIAYVGATILHVGKNVRKLLVGGKQNGGVCDEHADRVKQAAQTGAGAFQGTTAILSRCNLTVFSKAVSLTTANPSCRIHFVGGLEGIGLSRIMDIWHLLESGRTENKNPDQPNKRIRDPMICSFAKRSENPYSALKTYAKQTEDKELDAKLCIVEKYGGRIPELVECLERCSEYDYRRADFILGTVHKAKGLEFDTVMITDDFIKVPASRHSLHMYSGFSLNKIPTDEWNLLYVAVTRARTTLVITNSIRRILTLAGEYFLASQMPPVTPGGSPPVPCMVTSCPNCVTPGSAFTMHKRGMNCTDGESRGGPLCEMCVWKCVGPVAFLMTDDIHDMAQINRVV